MKRLIGFVIVPVVCLIACGGSGIHLPADGATYNRTVLADHPVAFWNMNQPSTTESDLAGNGNTGTYQGGTPTVTTMPNGDQVAVFNGSTEYLTVPSNASFSIPTTGNLTSEVWIKPNTLQFPGSAGSGGDYVDFMGKCDSYSGSRYGRVRRRHRPSIPQFAVLSKQNCGIPCLWSAMGTLISAR